jgi:predicted O-methyltransferase YrrM
VSSHQINQKTREKTVTNEFNHLVPQIREYLAQFQVDETELQKKMRQQAACDGREHWLVPKEVGLFIFFITRLTKAKRIFEIGSYLGYSGIWFAKALSANGQVVLTENNRERYQLAKEFLELCDLKPKMTLKYCDALQDLTNNDNQYDIILIDHDKPYYCDAFEIAKTRIKPDGIILADNVLWRRRIVDPNWENDSSTQGIVAFNKLIMNDPDVISMIVPIGDGVSFSQLK